jgi:hypothetical protein
MWWRGGNRRQGYGRSEGGHRESWTVQEEIEAMAIEEEDAWGDSVVKN